MQFLAVSRRRTDRFSEAQFSEVVKAEVHQARVLYSQGFIRHIWHRRDIAGGCLLVEADSLEEAGAQLNTLPMYQSGMVEVTLIPLAPYAGFCPSHTPGLDP